MTAAPSQLFERRVSVLVGKPALGPGDMTGAITVEDLRVTFRVEKDIGKQPNKCECVIYNLNPKHRALLSGKGNKLVLQAGYPGTIAQLFSGDVRYVDHPHVGADYQSKFECGDGERAIRWSRISQTFNPKTDGATIVKGIVSKLGINPGNLKDIASKITVASQNGYTAHGNAADELDKLLTANGYTWSVQDGELQILGGAVTNWKGRVPLISADSGMIGSPERGTPAEKGKPQFLKVKTLLMPQLRPGGKVSLKSRQFNGPYLLWKVTHTGDTFGGDWQSECECLPLAAGAT